MNGNIEVTQVVVIIIVVVESQMSIFGLDGRETLTRVYDNNYRTVMHILCSKNL